MPQKQTKSTLSKRTKCVDKAVKSRPNKENSFSKTNQKRKKLDDEKSDSDIMSSDTDSDCASATKILQKPRLATLSKVTKRVVNEDIESPLIDSSTPHKENSFSKTKRKKLNNEKSDSDINSSDIDSGCDSATEVLQKQRPASSSRKAKSACKPQKQTKATLSKGAKCVASETVESPPTEFSTPDKENSSKTNQKRKKLNNEKFDSDINSSDTDSDCDSATEILKKQRPAFSNRKAKSTGKPQKQTKATLSKGAKHVVNKTLESPPTDSSTPDKKNSSKTNQKRIKLNNEKFDSDINSTDSDSDCDSATEILKKRRLAFSSRDDTLRVKKEEIKFVGIKKSSVKRTPRKAPTKSPAVMPRDYNFRQRSEKSVKYTEDPIEIFDRKPRSRRMSTPRFNIDGLDWKGKIGEELIKNVAQVSSEKIHDKDNGTSCHQCRQKTLDTKTICKNKECFGAKGQFCGPCLRNRYGETVELTLVDADWFCPPCRGICNCSFCRKKQGKMATGIMVNIAARKGYSNVNEYLNHAE